MTVAFPGESAEYRAARNRLLEQEIELRRAMEAVAAARRQLPPGGVVPQDYVFQTQGPGGHPAGTTYNRDYLAETPDGKQKPMLNVFHRDGQTIRHFWSSELFYAPADSGQEPRHVGTLEPLWNLFDLTPEGRGTDWYEQLSY
jgi:predicted dithiol-disulfide oxidoreductase (DUF899 family)